MILEKVEKKDIPKIVLMLKKEKPREQVSELDFVEKISSDDFILLKFSDAQKIVAFTLIRVVSDDIAKLYFLIVSEQSRRKGIGKEFLQKIVFYLEKKGFSRIQILVDADNKTAKDLYQSIGFAFTSLYLFQGKNIEELELELEFETPSYVG